MKWNAQVVHVGRKDLARVRWPLLVYAAVVAGATVSNLGWAVAPERISWLWTTLVVVLGMMLAGLLVQEDAPARARAFWATLPLRPSAVLAAKLAGVGLFLVVPGLLGQLAALQSRTVAGGDLPGLLVVSVLTYAGWLALAAAVAALTPDFRAFALCLVLVVLAWMFGGTAAALALGGPEHVESPPRLLVPAVLVTAGLLVVGHQYHTRDQRRGVWLAALAGTALVGLPLVPYGSAPAAAAPPAATRPIPPSLRPGVLALDELRVSDSRSLSLGIRLERFSPHHRYVIRSVGVTLERRNGRVEHGRLLYQNLWLNSAALRLPERLEWIGQEAVETPVGAPRTYAPPSYQTRFPVTVSDRQREALLSGGATPALSGVLEVREPRVRMELPLRAGAAGTYRGRRWEVLSAGVVPVEQGRRAPSVELRLSSIRQDNASDYGWASSHREADAYVLVNRGRGEAVPLTNRSSSESGVGLVLPSSNQWISTKTLQPRDIVPESIGAEWLRNARLLVVEWVPVGGEPIVLRSK
ncbi:MAG TPA: hypothetical protein VNP72_11395 [Longimicrobium sp.]|nr:hypothetical protein [Longimicrobium sp.]